MIPEMMWIIGFYVAAAAWVHAWHGRNAGDAADKRHYVLLAGNHQLQMEWYVRALRYFSKRTGTDIGITVVLDRASSDETGSIVELLARQDSGIELIRSADARGESVVHGGICGTGETGAGGEIGGIGMLGSVEEQRAWMLMRLASTGRVASPGQVVWVDLGNEEELRRLPV